MEDINSRMTVTHEFHEAWATTKSNDSTVYPLREFLIPELMQEKGHGNIIQISIII